MFLSRRSRLSRAGRADRPASAASLHPAIIAVFALFATAGFPIAAPAAATPKRLNIASPTGRVNLSPGLSPKSGRGVRGTGREVRSARTPSSVLRPPSSGASRPAPVTLLNQLGRLARPVAPAELSDWKTEFHHGHLTADSAAKLHIWLGEYELAANEQPELAIWHFGRVSSHGSARLRGLAAYDTALASYYEGAYADSQQSFRRLLSLKTGLPGYSIKSCALWARMAGACAGYHAERAAMGIPEPTRLDPYCVAAALAECLRAMGRPYSRAWVKPSKRSGNSG